MSLEIGVCFLNEYLNSCSDDVQQLNIPLMGFYVRFKLAPIFILFLFARMHASGCKFWIVLLFSVSKWKICAEIYMTDGFLVEFWVFGEFASSDGN